MTVNLISLDSAIIITGLSRRTLWRRVSDGCLRKVGEDRRGRTLLAVADVLQLMRSPLALEDGPLLVKADAEDADAQADVAAIFHARQDFEPAVYWWRQAAEQGHPDAMQWLGRCYAAGEGLEKNEHLAVMWISRSASQGHAIAAAQMAQLLRRFA